jgi:hypothetical protein
VLELERQLREAHEQYARRIRTLEARAAAAEAAAAGRAAAAPPPAGDAREDGARQGDQASREVVSELRQLLALRNKQAAEVQHQLCVAERQVRHLQLRLQQQQRQQQQQQQQEQQQQQQQQQQQEQQQRLPGTHEQAASGILVAHCAEAETAQEPDRPVPQPQPQPVQPQPCKQRHSHQWEPQAPAAEQRLQLELAASQGALVLLQRAHAELMERSVELGAAQQRALDELRGQVAAREAARWQERVAGLEEVRAARLRPRTRRARPGCMPAQH